jgi:hypothetical protein
MNYRKLCRAREAMATDRWYAGDDHLLLARWQAYTIEYKRVFFADLQSVMLWRTPAWYWRMAVIAAAGGLLTWLFWMLSLRAGLILLALTLAGVGAELILGPTAVAELRTASQRLRAPLTGRLNSSIKKLEEIRALATLVQGALPAGITVELYAGENPARADTRKYAGHRWSAAIWAYLLVFAALGGSPALPAVYQSHRTYALALTLRAAAFAFAAFAIIQTYRFRAVAGLRGFLWLSLASVIGRTVVVAGYSAFLGMQFAARGGPFPIASSPQVLSISRFTALILLLLAGFGAALSLVQRGHFEMPPDATPAGRQITPS